jgi:hypothetical protein
LWVECSEQVFNTVAHSSAYGHLQGELGNAAVRLRARIQKVVEQGLRQFDLPTRSEINSVHQQLRQLRLRVAELEANATASNDAAQAPASTLAGAKADVASTPRARPAQKVAPAARKRSKARTGSTR